MTAALKKWKTGFVMALSISIMAPGVAIMFFANHLAPGLLPLAFTVVICYAYREQLLTVLQRPLLRWPVLILSVVTAALSLLNEHFRSTQSSVLFIVVPITMIAAYLFVVLRTANVIYSAQAEL